MPNRVEIRIDSFDPLQITFPDRPITGPVAIILPPMDLKLIDLSMGGSIPGAYIGSRAPVASVNIDLGSHVMSAGDMTEFISRSRAALKEAWQLYQAGLNEIYLIDRGQDQ